MRTIPFAFAALLACGPTIETTGGAGGAGAGNAGAGGATDPICGDPDRYQVCQGPNDCSPTDCGCLPLGGADHDDIGVCAVQTNEWIFAGHSCPDGGVLVGPIGEACVPWEVGKLFCDNGARDLVRFVDYGAFDCEALPDPDTCPVTETLELCGSACGACKETEFCHGRSRLHPYGMCLPLIDLICRATSANCGADEACFVFTVDEASQPLADKWGLCLPTATCQAAAAELPGGGKCYANL
ncbi:MAG: hypothetical protein U0271_07095 [Polyangiaceae bacterium]